MRRLCKKARHIIYIDAKHIIQSVANSTQKYKKHEGGKAKLKKLDSVSLKFTKTGVNIQDKYTFLIQVDSALQMHHFQNTFKKEFSTFAKTMSIHLKADINMKNIHNLNKCFVPKKKNPNSRASGEFRLYHEQN